MIESKVTNDRAFHRLENDPPSGEGSKQRPFSGGSKIIIHLMES